MLFQHHLNVSLSLTWIEGTTSLRTFSAMGRPSRQPPALSIAAPADLPPIDELNDEQHPVHCRRGDVCHPSHDWPRRATETRVARPGSTLGDCIAATLRDAQARLRYAPRHNFEVFRQQTPHVMRRRRPTLGGRAILVRACPSAHKTATGKVLYAFVGENDRGKLCLALRQADSRDVAEMWLCQLEVVRIADRMVALVPLASGELPRAVIEHDVKIMGILLFDDNKAIDDFLALLVTAGGLTPTNSSDDDKVDELDLTPTQGRRLRIVFRRQSTCSERSAFRAWSTFALCRAAARCLEKRLGTR